jgi:Domain of unknown function (DUF4437)
MRSMRRIAGLVAPMTVLFLALPTVVSAADAPADHVFINSADMKWMAAPPSLPKGAKLAVLYGDPGKSGPFVMRLMTPANYKIGPHWHSQAENLSIVSGTLYLGRGDKMDKAKAHGLKAGGFHFLPGKAHHYAFTKTATIVQIHGEGPFDITYINAEDDPAKAAKK